MPKVRAPQIADLQRSLELIAERTVKGHPLDVG